MTSSDRYRGFDLSSVCWGYRDLFAKTIEGLFEEHLIGDDRPQVTAAFFRLLRCAEQQHFDYVLKEFLASLNAGTAWILDLPGIFAEVTELGREFAQSRLNYGIRYFRTLGEGGFGRSPQEVRYLITTLKRLRAVDEELAMAFLSGYGVLIPQLTPVEIDRYVHQGMRAFHQNPDTGRRFMEGTLKTSDLTIRALTQEARLEEMAPALERLLRALVGYEVEAGDLSRLDSDELIERGTRMVCLARWLYLPQRMRHFDAAAQNRNWYRLCGVVAAGALAFDSFSRIHGHPHYATCADLVGGDLARLNLFQIVEYARILARSHARWPGARRLLAFGLETELAAQPPESAAAHLFFQLVAAISKSRCGASKFVRESDFVATGGAEQQAVVLQSLATLVQDSLNAFDTADLLTPELVAQAVAAYPGLGARPLRTFAFLPDFLYPGEIGHPPPDALVADLKARARQRQAERRAEEDAQRHLTSDSDSVHDQEETGEQGAGVAAAYVYDEWSQEENDYYHNYCYVHEMAVAPAGARDLPLEIMGLAQRTRRAFELLRPELRKEKYLAEGDAINVDLLTNYLVQRTREPAPRVNFYEKPFHNQRDLATLILLDVSGSTGSEVDRHKTIEIEQHAALILGQGLASLGDRFAVGGFSGNGREQCEFFIFKDFAARWDRSAIARILAARPRSATRIGAALRHAGYRLSQVAARQRLILLITDGKPMDTGYDPATRYAQYDVRMACQENLRQSIHTFCISIDGSNPADMEIMFPQHRYVLLPDVRKLPHLLPRLYLRLTA